MTTYNNPQLRSFSCTLPPAARETAKHKGVNPELLNLFGQITNKIIETLLTVGYGQPQEFEADSLGQTFATQAGYDPLALRRFAALMQHREKGGDKSLTARLGTHPSFTDRLAKLPPAKETAPAPSALGYRRLRFRSALR